MIFPVIECDGVIQINDKFRISGEKSYKTINELQWTSVEIEPYAGAGFINVTGNLTKPSPEKNWYVDCQYDSVGPKVISLKITIGVTIVIVTKTVEVLSVAADNLFSTDDLLKENQSDIFKLLPDGRATFVYKHRAAQNFILDWLWNNGYAKNQGQGFSPFVKADIVDKDFISDWATFVCLRMLFEENQSQGGDVFRIKAGDFLNKEEKAREKFLLKLDTNGDSVLSPDEGAQITSRRFERV